MTNTGKAHDYKVMKKWEEKAKKLGFNLIGGNSAWNGVEIHLRIFGHLPEGKTCYRFTCTKGDMAGNYEKVEEFLEKLVS